MDFVPPHTQEVLAAMGWMEDKQVILHDWWKEQLKERGAGDLSRKQVVYNGSLIYGKQFKLYKKGLTDFMLHLEIMYKD